MVKWNWCDIDGCGVVDVTELGPERTYRIVGLTHVSISPDTRPLFPNAQPPDDAAYISSMAVDRKYRR